MTLGDPGRASKSDIVSGRLEAAPVVLCTKQIKDKYPSNVHFTQFNSPVSRYRDPQLQVGENYICFI